MAKRSKSQRPQEASAPAVEAAARIAPRRKTADRRLWILERLTNGLSVAAAPLDLVESRLGEAGGKFSASQALEIPRNAEGISDSALLERLAAPERRPIPPNPARGENRGISIAGFAPREADGKRSRPEMAPQRLEKIESAPGNGWARKPRTYKMWYTGAG